MQDNPKSTRGAEHEIVFGDDTAKANHTNMSEFDTAFDNAIRLKEIETEMDKLNILPPSTLAEHIAKNAELSVLSEEQKERQLTAVLPKLGKVHPKGGAPKAPLTEVVEKVYKDLHERGDTEVIKPGNIVFFMDYLKRCITEKNSNESDYVQERIKKMKKISGRWVIVMQPLTGSQKIKLADTGKDETFDQSYVSKVLSDLRKEIPLPS